MSRDIWIRNAAVLLIAALVGFPAVAMAAIQVKLEASPQSNPTALGVTDNDSQCPGEDKSCIDVAKGSTPNMFFDLDKACKQGGPNYKLSAFRLAEASKDWPTPAKPLRQDIADDFNADPTTGYIKWGTNDSTLSDAQIKLKNKNTKAYSVYYEITATACNGAGEIKLDPVIRNGGGGNP